MTEPIFTPEQLADVLAYQRPHYVLRVVLDVVNLTLSLLVLRYLARPGWRWSAAVASKLKQRFARLRTAPVTRVLWKVFDRLWGGEGWGAALLFAIALLMLDTVVLAPVDFYFGFKHEHDFGLSTEPLSGFVIDFFKGLLLSAIPLGALAFGLFALARRLPKWWLVMGLVAAGGLLFSAAIDPFRSRVYYNQKPLPDGELRTQITSLMSKAQIDFQDVLVEETLSKTVKVQAYFAGRGPTRRIVLNDSLIKNMSTDEVLAAVAHEAGHVSEDRWKGQLATTLALLGFLYLVERLFRLTARKGWWGITERADIRALPLILTVFWLVTELGAPISGFFGREREREADRYGLALTQNPDAFRRMLVKAARVNKMDPNPPAWIVWRGRSHPTIQERIDAVGP